MGFLPSGDSTLLRAVDLLRQLNAEYRRVLSEETSLEFVPARWRPYVNDDPDPLRAHQPVPHAQVRGRGGVEPFRLRPLRQPTEHQSR